MTINCKVLLSDPAPFGVIVSNIPDATTKAASAPTQVVPPLTLEQINGLRESRDSFKARAKRSERERDEARKKLYDAYHERNQLVAFLARIVPYSHLVEADEDSYPATRIDADREIVRPMVCIHITTQRNLTWHFSPDEMGLFQDLPFAPSDWDGHTTEAKYELLELLGQAALKRRAQTKNETSNHPP